MRIFSWDPAVSQAVHQTWLWLWACTALWISNLVNSWSFNDPDTKDSKWWKCWFSLACQLSSALPHSLQSQAHWVCVVFIPPPWCTSALVQGLWNPTVFLGFKMLFTLTQKTLKHSKLNAGQQDMSPLLNPLQNGLWKTRLELTTSNLFTSFLLIFTISEFQENILDSSSHLPYKFYLFIFFSEVRETLFLSEGVPHHKVQNQMSTDVILCSNPSECIRLCIHNS